MKRLLALILAFAMVITLLPASVLAADDDVTVGKTATDNADGTYTIDLSVLGTDVTTQTTADVILAIDLSNSMTNNGSDNLSITVDAAKKFIADTIKPDGNVRVALVAYGCDSFAYNFTTNSWQKYTNATISGDNYFTRNPSSATSVITANSFKPGGIDSDDGGTNTEGGLLMCQSVMATSSSGNKIVIFMTDGLPTYRYSTYEWGGQTGTGSTNDMSGSRTSAAEFNEAVDAGLALHNAGVTVYTVGLLTDYTEGSSEIDIADHLLSDENAYTLSIEWKQQGRDWRPEYSFAVRAGTEAYSSGYTAITDATTAARDIAAIYEALAEQVNDLAAGTVTDIIPAEFSLSDAQRTALTEAGCTVTENADGTVTIVWPVAINSTEKDLSYTITPRDGYYGAAYTNESAVLTYTLAGEEQTVVFPKPVVPINTVEESLTDTAPVYAATATDVLTGVGTKLTAEGHTVTDLAVTNPVVTSGVTGATTSVSVNEAGELAFTADRVGTYTITYTYTTIVDGTPCNGSGTLTVTVTPIPLTVTAGTASKAYDGTALTCNTYETAGLAAGDTISAVTLTGSQTAVGSSDNVASAAAVSRNGADVTANYTISYVKGTLTVTDHPDAIVITADGGTKVYDGTALTAAGYTATGVPTGHTLTAVTTGTITDVGTASNTIASYTIVNDTTGLDVTASFPNVTTAPGTLEVTRRAITLTADSDTKEYDGTALTRDSYQVTAGSVVAGETHSATVTGSQTAVGSSDNVVSDAAILRGTTNVTANYDISYVDGTLTVTENDVVIDVTADTSTKVYDGTALTDDGYTVTGLPSGFTLEATTSGSVTYVHEGEVANTIASYTIYNADAEDVTASFTGVTTTPGQLTITARPLTITANSNSKIYDGTALTDSGYTVAAGTPLQASDAVASVTVTGSQTDVGSSANVASAAVIQAGDVDVTTSYAITYEPGTLAVTPYTGTITFTADTNTKVYDGTALTDDGCTVIGLPEGFTYRATVEGSATYVTDGEVANVVTDYAILFGGVDVTSNFTGITTVDGKLTITVHPITVTAASASKAYDGTPLTDSGFTSAGEVTGETVVAVITGSQTVKGSSANVVGDVTITDGAADVTANYDITKINGSLTVTGKADTIVITADSNSKVYDGTALTDDGYTFTQGILAEGDTLSAVVEGTITNVGSVNNVVTSWKVTNADGDDVTDSYTIETANGTLAISQRVLTIVADTATKVYDGTALIDDSYTVQDAAMVAAGDTVASVTVTGSQTTVGSSANVASAARLARDGVDVTANYNISYTTGTLTVTERPLTITAASSEKEYDGTALTDDGYSITAGTLAEGETLDSVTVTGSQTIVGSSANVASNAVIGTTTANYDITYVDGTLTVRGNTDAIVVTADSSTKVYDAAALTDAGFATTGLLDGFDLEATVSGSQTVVGSSTNTVTGHTITNAAGDDVTAYFTNVTYAAGELEVTSRPLTITAASSEKEYDGTALTDDGYSITAGTLAEGESITSVTVTGSQTNVGTSANVASDAVIGTTTANYAIEYVDGKLEVYANDDEIVITADSNSKVYDGTALTDDGYSVTGLPNGFTLTAVVEGSQAHVGTSANTVTGYAIYFDGVQVSNDFFSGVTTAAGTLTVTKRPVTITADSDSKVYDGTPLTDDGYAATGAAATDTVTAVTAGSQTVAGSSANVIDSYTITCGGTDVSADYDVTLVPGTLTVTKRTDLITVLADDNTRVYDGTALTDNGYTFDETLLADGDTLTAVVEGTITDVGSADNVVSSYAITNAAGADVTASYTTTSVNGTLIVTARPLAITAGSADKVYDGTPLTCSTYSLGDTSVAERDTLTVYTSGSQTQAGSSANVVSSYTILNGETDVSANYAVTTYPGTLVVRQSEDEIVITAASSEKVYDGTALTDSGYTYDTTLLAEGDSLTAVVEGSITNVGQADNEVISWTITNAAGENVTASYTVSGVKGTLTVTQRTLDLTAGSDERIYDGTALTKPTYAITAETSLAEGDALEVLVAGSQTDVGASANTITSATVLRGETDVTANYAITTHDGLLTVTARPLTITADSNEKEYDGTALTDNGYAITAGTVSGGQTLSSVTVTGSQLDVGSSANVASAAVILAGETDVTANYAIEYVDGTLTVKRNTDTITIKAASSTKVYDATALTNDTYTYEGTIFTGDTLQVTVTGSQTDVGTSANVVTAYRVLRGEQDVTAFYTFAESVDGTLTVNPKPVTVRPDDQYAVYTGETQTVTSDLHVTAGAVVEGHTIAGTASASGLNVGNYPMELDEGGVQIFAGETDVTANYTITFEPATFRIGAGELTLNNEDHMRYMQGYPNGSFQPEKNMTRAEVAVMFCRLLNNDMEITAEGTNPFSDVASNAWYYNEVIFMAEHGIIKGYTDGTFKPNAPISRAEFATICTRFDVARQSEATPLETDFTDVPASAWYYDFVMTAAGNGWVGGFPDGTFRPNDKITRAQVVTVVNRVLERVADEAYVDNAVATNVIDFRVYNDVASHWAFYNIYEASASHDYEKDEAGKETWLRHWSDLFTVSFHISGTTPDVAAGFDAVYAEGAEVALPSGLDVAALHNGSFLGWSLTEGDNTPLTGYTVNPADSYVSPNGVDHQIIHFYAVWG